MLSLCWKSKGKSGPWSADLLDCLLTGARVAPWSVSVFSTLHILVFCSLRFIWFLESSLSSHPILCSPQGRAKVYRVGINISRLCLTIPYLNFLYCSLWIALSICLCKCVCFCFSLSLFLAFPIFSRDFHLPSIHHTSPRPLLFCITPPPLIPPTRQIKDDSRLSCSGVTSSPGSHASSALSLCFRWFRRGSEGRQSGHWKIKRGKLRHDNQW